MENFYCILAIHWHDNCVGVWKRIPLKANKRYYYLGIHQYIGLLYKRAGKTRVRSHKMLCDYFEMGDNDNKPDLKGVQHQIF